MLDSQCAAGGSDCPKGAEMHTQKLTILYSRLSRDDEAAGESMSIANQKSFLEDYANRNGFTNWVHKFDDGWSGTNFQRPAWNEVIAEIEAGNVANLVSKDSSRLARDYLRMGLYREMFREKGVRLICVNDGVDTAKGEDDFTPFREIINEWFARDTSRKIRAINDARIKEGKHVTGAVPYGYLHDPDDRQKWIIDSEAGPIVKRIYQMTIDGKGITQIAETLSAERVPVPSAHWRKVNAGMRSFPGADPYRWSATMVSNVLKREEYMGWCVLNKSVKETYKSKRRNNAPEDRLIFKDAHPAIVDGEMWTVVQRLRETKRVPQRTGGDPNPLTGVLYCADCGHKMHHKQGKNATSHKQHDEYCCSSYRHYSRSCTYHHIRVDAIEKLILQAIKTVSGFVRENETEFVEKVRSASAIKAENAVKENRKRLTKSRRRREETGGLIRKLYESYAADKIPEKHFAELLAGYDAEQTALDGEIEKLQAEIDAFAADSVRTDKFIELVNRYTEFDEFSAALLNEFVERVIVHEADKSTGTRTQEVEIIFNFIGKFDLPKDAIELPAEEEKPTRKCKPRTEKDREYDRRRYAKKRDARIAAELAERAAILEGTSFAV
jgi:DNA invertase Pin-like site-specific DNA recombinase